MRAPWAHEFIAKANWLFWLLILASVAPFARAQSTPPWPSAGAPHNTARLAMLAGDDSRSTFDLENAGDLLRLADLAAQQAAAIAESEKIRWRMRQDLLAETTPAEMSPAALRKLHAEPPPGQGRKDRRALEFLRDLSQAAAAEPNISARHKWVEQIEEVMGALYQNRVSPAPVSVEFLDPPVVLLDYSYNPVARGNTPASNLERYDVVDLSLVDPLPSTIWQRPRSFADQDLFYGFNRKALPDLTGRIWDYAGPKTGYGRSPGFDAAGGGRRIKVKFGETLSEPLTARLFAALGYHVDATDRAVEFKLRYDRRFFREFHLRRPVQTEIRLLWLTTIYTLHMQKRHDPFRFVSAAVFKDGTTVVGSQLKRLLLRHSDQGHPEDDPANFRVEIEQAIDHLVLVPANVQIGPSAGENLGAWSYAGLGHEDRRELRGACLLAAWLTWCDTRFENTRVRVLDAPNGPELRHFFTDLGGGLGKANGILTRSSESPNQFPWTFTHPPKYQGKGHMTIPFRIHGYQPIQDTLAFEKMTTDDARWMGRLIGQLSEDQLLAALVGAGFESAAARLYLEKLISRRDDMLRDLGLAEVLGLLRPQGAERQLHYDPVAQGPIRIRTRDGREQTAPAGSGKLVRGRLVDQKEAR